ncbi:MAG: OadG family transporter subunit [Campylobacterota bacterium]|nr:OadG family transporter subunit [Campylobacterota bacterium]
MEDVNLVVEGFKFMVLGMGTVLTFLIILIGAMLAQAKIIAKYFPEPKPVPATPNKATKNNNKIAAISAAIMHHKNTK